MTGEIMKKYEEYEVTRTTRTTDSQVFLAAKRDVEVVNGISFSHMFYFQKVSNSKKANCTVNGVLGVEFEPNFTDNHYYAFVEDGIIHSLDMKTFFFEQKGLGYVNRKIISPDELADKVMEKEINEEEGSLFSCHLS